MSKGCVIVRRLAAGPHGGNEIGDTPAVKRGRRDAALAPPKFALADEEPVAEERAEQVPQELALAIVHAIGQQHLFDVFRLDDQEAVQE
jgi:hypothetical protein